MKPSRLDLDPNSPTASKEWKYWKRTYENFIAECGENAPDKLRTLVNYVSHTVFDLIEDCSTYEDATRILEATFVKAPNEIFARYLLASRQQQPSESLDEFLRELKKLSKDCNFKSVTAERYCQEMIRDSFIKGIISPNIRQRLLENKTLDLQTTAYDQTYSLELARKNAESYVQPSVHAAAVPNSDESLAEKEDNSASTAAAMPTAKKKCFFCGNQFHHRNICPAKDAACNSCVKKGHFSKVCRSTNQGSRASKNLNLSAMLASSSCPPSLSSATTKARINGRVVSALVDTGSSESFVSADVAQKLKLDVNASNKLTTMASTSLNMKSTGTTTVDLEVNNVLYPTTSLGVLHNLCCDLLLGQDFQRQHKSLIVVYGGAKESFRVGESVTALSSAKVEEPSLFPNLPPKCKPIATKSRRFSSDDQLFIMDQVSRLLAEGIIESSKSPWRAQVVVVKDEHRKRRLCIDYSQTINLYTELDAYPLPNIDDMINRLAKYSVFSTST